MGADDIQGVERKGDPRPERLYSVSELAGMYRVPYRTMLRRLLALHKKHGGPWLMRIGSSKFHVNLSQFKAHHPHVFAVDTVTRDDVAELQDRVIELGRQVSDERARLNGAFGRIRRLENDAKQVSRNVKA